MYFDWTEERMERAKHLWLERNFTASQIAKELGCSRNSVIGKLHRMGVDNRGRMAEFEQKVRVSTSASKVQLQAQRARQTSTIARRAKGELSPAVSKASVPNLALIIPEQPPLNIGLMELTSFTCRWVTSDEAPTTYCGHTVKQQSAWCPFHHSRVYHRDPAEQTRIQYLRDKNRDRSAFGALRVA